MVDDRDIGEPSARRPDQFEGFAETARALYASEDLEETLGRLTWVAVAAVNGCDVASVSLLESDGRISSRAPTDSQAVHADAIQHKVGEGPCFDAAEAERWVYTTNVAADERWPRFSARLSGETPAGSMLAVRLGPLAGAKAPRSFGALNLYANRTHAFDEEDRMLALLLAPHASAVIDASMRHQQLREAIESRDVIGQAKGILMSQGGLTAQQAFAQLMDASQRFNVKVRELAHRLTAEHEGKPSHDG